jgi:D-beta-D-heptose 7-phosphate kinase/D-beta-D-heptose 1-phosphate adenosyltransferase
MQNKIEIPKPKILVIGDMMLDEYVYGEVKRLNPESSAPLVNLTDVVKKMPGGAANVANNLSVLGADVIVMGVVGKDSEATSLTSLMAEKGINVLNLVVDSTRPTIKKTRIMVNGMQLVRFDSERTHSLTKDIFEIVKSILKPIILDVDIVLVSDYGKGLIDIELSAEIERLSKKFNKKILIDPPNKEVRLVGYGEVELIKLNKKEAGLATKIPMRNKSDYINAAKTILIESACNRVVITLGSEGLIYMDRGTTYSKNPLFIPAEFVEVHDLAGAGDTFFSILGFIFSQPNFSISTALKYANKAASIVVSKSGTATVTWNEIFSNKNKIVEKDWGYEEWIVNGELYCGKKLVVGEKWGGVSKGKYHFHKKKDETFYILKGNLILDFPRIDSILLKPGDSYRIKPGLKHRFKAQKNKCIFVEFSTHHSDKDTYYDRA